MSVRSVVALLVASVLACSSPPAAPTPPPAVAPAPAPPPVPGPAAPPTIEAQPDISSVAPADAPVPTVRTGEAVVSEGLSGEVIRRVIRRHMNEVRYCYVQALAVAPTLNGRLTMRFVIERSGAASGARVWASELSADGAPDGGEAARELGTCVAGAMDRWTYPAPDRPAVTVDYPFVLTPTAPEPPSTPPGEVGAAGEGTIGIGSLHTVGS